MSYFRLIGALVGIGALIAAGWTVNSWRVERAGLKLEVAHWKEAKKQCESELAGSAQNLAMLQGEIDSANTEIAHLQTDGERMANLLTDATLKNAKDQVEFERRLAELSKPLPSDCQEAVREMARRLGSMP